MKIEKGRKLDFFRELFEEWKSKSESETALLERHMAQYEGSREIDPLPGGGAAAYTADMAPEEVFDDMEESTAVVQASVVRNITYELIEAQVSTNIPAPRVNPCRYSEKRDKNARNIERLLMAIRDELPFERMNDLEERLAPIHGASARVIDWDDSIRTHDTVGRVDVTVMDMLHIVGQPGVWEIQDMDAVFVLYDTTKAALTERYGVSFAAAEQAEPEEENIAPDDSVTAVVCWYRNEEGRVCKFSFSGEVQLEDIENYWARKRRVCDTCGRRAELSEDSDAEDGKCACGGNIIEVDEEFEELTHDILDEHGNVMIPALSPVYENGKIKMRTVSRPLYDELGRPLTQTMADGSTTPLTEMVDEPIYEPTRIRWYRPDVFPVVVRKNTSRNMSLLGQSDCAFIRAQQQFINKVESRKLRKLMSSGVYAVKPDGSKWMYDNSVGDKVLVLAPGEHKSDYGVIDTQVSTALENEACERAYDHSKRILGITDTFTGQADNTAKSGLAKQVQVQQSAGRLASKRVMKSAAFAEGDEAIFKLYLAFADEPRPASYVNEFGEVQNVQFNRYDFVEFDEITGEWYYNDGYRFSCDGSAAIYENQYEQLWQLIASDFTSGMYGDPNLTVTKLAVWLAREKARYPGAHTQVEFFRKLLEAERAAAERAKQPTQNNSQL